MWDSAMAENGILKVGRVTDFQAHQMEHQLGAYTDCNHGQGLAVIHPAYYRHIVKDAEEKFARFGKEVFGVDTAEELSLIHIFPGPGAPRPAWFREPYSSSGR